MITLFLAWKSPQTRSWHVIGRLTREHDGYRFGYTQGAEDAQRNAGFNPEQMLPMFPATNESYWSSELFAPFRNRIPSESRPDFKEYLKWLDLDQAASEPMMFLIKSAGRRATDDFELFPVPDLDRDGCFISTFFVHGIRHLPPASLERVSHLNPGDKLEIMQEPGNAHDPLALKLQTIDRAPVGYCPRYLLPDIRTVVAECVFPCEFEIVRVNPPPAPLQFRLLCRMTGCWPNGFVPMRTAEFQPICNDPTQSPGRAVLGDASQRE